MDETTEADDVFSAEMPEEVAGDTVNSTTSGYGRGEAAVEAVSAGSRRPPAFRKGVRHPFMRLLQLPMTYPVVSVLFIGAVVLLLSWVGYLYHHTYHKYLGGKFTTHDQLMCREEPLMLGLQKLMWANAKRELRSMRKHLARDSASTTEKHDAAMDMQLFALEVEKYDQVPQTVPNESVRMAVAEPQPPQRKLSVESATTEGGRLNDGGDSLASEAAPHPEQSHFDYLKHLSERGKHKNRPSDSLLHPWADFGTPRHTSTSDMVQSRHPIQFREPRFEDKSIDNIDNVIKLARRLEEIAESDRGGVDSGAAKVVAGSSRTTGHLLTQPEVFRGADEHNARHAIEGGVDVRAQQERMRRSHSDHVGPSLPELGPCQNSTRSVNISIFSLPTIFSSTRTRYAGEEW
jgi:hypothetical protein